VLDKKTGEKLACKSISKRKLTTADDIADVQREVQVRGAAGWTLVQAAAGAGCSWGRGHQPALIGRVGVSRRRCEQVAGEGRGETASCWHWACSPAVVPLGPSCVISAPRPHPI